MLADLKDTCNNCGGTLAILELDGKKYVDGLINARVSGAYNSKYLSDCTDYRFSLCEKCLSEIFAKFKIPPYFGDYGFASDAEADNETFKEHLDNLKYRRWISEVYHIVNNETVLNADSDAYKHFLKNKCTYKYKCKHKAKYLIGNHLDYIGGINVHSICEQHYMQSSVINNEKLFPYLTMEQQIKAVVFK